MPAQPLRTRADINKEDKVMDIWSCLWVRNTQFHLLKW